MRRRTVAVLGAFAVATVGLPVAMGQPAVAAPTELFISEYVEGSSNNKALEIYNGTGTTVDLSDGAYNVQMFFNGSVSPGLTVNLSGATDTVADGDVYVLAQSSASAGILAVADQTNGSGWFNGDDAVVLRKGTAVIDVIGQVGVDPGAEWGSGLTSTADNTLRRRASVEAGDPDPTDAFDPSVQWEGFAIDTFDGLGTHLDTAPPPPQHGACGDPATPIHAIQGTGPSSPLTGQLVTVEGVVVGDYQASGQFGGYFLQEEDADADADPATSEGLFVFNTATPVAPGDTVRVAGRAGEFGNLTQLSNVTGTSTCSTGQAVTPAAMSLPVPAVDDWERVEGMSVAIAQDLTVTEVFTLARFGEVSLSAGGRLETPTNEVSPGAAAIALQNLNDRSRILLDDGNNQQNIDPTRYPQGGLSASNTLRVGDSLPSGLTGVLDFRFGAYRVQPVGPIAFDHTNPRPTTPADVGGDVTVAAFNVLNYFNGDGAGGGFPTSRGADTQVELDRQRAKIVSAITALDADVVGLMELENDDTDAGLGAVEDLVAALNAVAGPGAYDFVDTGVVGSDAIRVGILYQPAAVTPVGDHAIIDSSVDPRFLDTLNRPSVAQTFASTATGARFTAVVNHLKSKGSDCNAVGDPDTGDGQGNCNGVRTAAAEALVDWLAGDPTGSGDSDVIVLGDLNAYAMEDPVTVFRDAGYVDTVDASAGDQAYSYVFRGQSGYLDHALASTSLAPQVTGVTEWHTNADEPVALDYNTEFKSPGQVDSFYAADAFRSSDHDPILVGLDLEAPPTVDAGGPYAVAEGSSVAVHATGADPDADPLSYHWDLDNDGTFETPGQTASFSAAGLQAPATRTIRVRVTDPAGHTATDTAQVDVVWAFEGFLDPVRNPPAVNVVSSGRVVPLSFRLGGDQGLDVLAMGSPSWQPIACDTGDPLGAEQPADDAGNSTLTYDAPTDTYTYAWKSSRGWTGCRQLTVALVDGTEHSARFQFVR